MSDIAAIEQQRLAAGLSIEQLTSIAGVAQRHYFRLISGEMSARAPTIAALDLALKRQKLRQTNQGETTVLYRLALAIAALSMKIDPARCQDQDPARRASFSAEWRKAAEARRLALYLLNVGCGLSQTRVAKAAGMTKQAVSLACREIEEKRSDRAFDQLADRLTAAITGEF